MQPIIENRKRGWWWLLAGLLFIFLVLPWLLWGLAICLDAMSLVLPMLYWTGVPGQICGEPLFKPTELGYNPAGAGGWAVTAFFWASIAVATWAIVWTLSSLRRRHWPMRASLLIAAIWLSACVTSPMQIGASAHNVMLSWKPHGQAWHFAFYSVLPLSYGAKDLSRPDMVIVGIPALKQRLSRQAPWRNIFWRDLIGSNRTYPDTRTTDEICMFAKTHGVNLELVPTIVD